MNQHTDDEGTLMTDAELDQALDGLKNEPDDTGELLKAMNENRIISWEEAERMMSDVEKGDSVQNVIKCSLPVQTRPTEPDNDTDVEMSLTKLRNNDPTLKQLNLNNMKRTPIPQIQRMIMAIKNNTILNELSLANMGLYDGDLEPLIIALENNTTLKAINLETNYLSGDFFAKLFRAILKNQTVQEIKVVNQGMAFSTIAEREIIGAICENMNLTKVSINLRLPEGRHRLENAMLRNGEIKRKLRRQATIAGNVPIQKTTNEIAKNKIKPPLVRALTQPREKDENMPTSASLIVPRQVVLESEKKVQQKLLIAQSSETNVGNRPRRMAELKTVHELANAPSTTVEKPNDPKLSAPLIVPKLVQEPESNSENKPEMTVEQKYEANIVQKSASMTVRKLQDSKMASNETKSAQTLAKIALEPTSQVEPITKTTQADETSKK